MNYQKIETVRIKGLVFVFLMGLFFQTAAQDGVLHDVLIHEIFADPTPSIGLPNAEFIEIRNRSEKTINLRNWVLTNGTTIGKIISNAVIKPDSLVLLVSGSTSGSFSKYGSLAIVSPFPALNNDGDTLILMNTNGQCIHSVAWDKSWYHNDIKESGGWSIELKDISKPCVGKENWGSSINNFGGTPGSRNSIEQFIIDTLPPKLTRAIVLDSLTVLLFFNEQLDSLSTNESLTIEPNIIIQSIKLLPPLYNTIRYNLKTPIRAEQIYQFSLPAVADCMKNRKGVIKGTLGKSSPPILQDIVINEVLFDPIASGFDYVEIYNRSVKIIDLKDVLLCNRNSLGKLSGQISLSDYSLPIFPNTYIVVTENAEWLHQNYSLKDSIIIVQRSPLPSFPNDKGDVVISDIQGNILDELVYDEKWHFELLSNTEGVALERINPNIKTQEKSNWHSAASNVGYGTPGYKNSQYFVSGQQINPITLSNSIISPNLDGFEDKIFVQYHFPEQGYVVNITVFDENGIAIKHLVRNGLCGTHGNFIWDGLSDGGKIPTNGNYLILTEVFTLKGSVKRYINNVAIVNG